MKLAIVLHFLFVKFFYLLEIGETTNSIFYRPDCCKYDYECGDGDGTWNGIDQDMITKIHVVVMTHLDVGFTIFGTKTNIKDDGYFREVCDRYVDTFYQQAS